MTAARPWGGASAVTRGLQSAALELAAAGWAVFPCVENGPGAKAPYTEHGHHDGTVEPAATSERWARRPNALIGARVPESLVVIDVDPRNGGSIAELEELVGVLPATLTVLSGRNDGGRHYYFLRPAGAFTSTMLPRGVDLKVNGYCILPPSPHPATGMPYVWETRPPVPLPTRLRELLRPAAPPVFRSTPRRGTGGPLVRLVAGLADGERNRGLFWAACRATEGGILGSVESELVAAAMSTGLPQREALRVVASASRALGGAR